MAEDEKELHFTVMYRGKPLQLKAPAGSKLGDLGKEIVDLTGVAPHTLRLILPKRAPLQPMSEQHSTKLLSQSGIAEGMKMTMMGSSSAEVAAVSQPLMKDRIIGFSEEEQRARQRSGSSSEFQSLPKGNYIFCDFQTLQLPGIELNPPPAMALKIMHKLARDRGITAIMNKYHWRVGIMTEMAPIGYVGISPKCILGFNKNRGQEISLRLRTDDLKGFRKYESIKKTLLHELAHMVHDEHDEKFHALDKKLNEEAIALDWTKSHGHTLSGVKFEDEEEEFTVGRAGSSRGYKLGGRTDHFVDPRTAAAAAALRRLGDAGNSSPQAESSQRTVPNSSMPVAKPRVQSEPDLDETGSQPVVVIASGTIGKEDAAPDEVSVCVPVRSEEPDPDEASYEHLGHKEPDPDAALDSLHGSPKRSHESDSHEASSGLSGASLNTGSPARMDELDSDEADDVVLNISVRNQDPDLDQASSVHSSRNEPDPDAAMDIVLDALVAKQEPDPDESSGGHPSSRNEPDPDEAVDIVLDGPVKKQEPDADEASGGHHSNRHEPDRDEAVEIVLDIPLRDQEPDPDEASGGHGARNEPDPDEAVGIVLDTPMRSQEPDPDAVLEADRDLNGCAGCSRMAGKRMKSSTAGGFTELAKPQKSS